LGDARKPPALPAQVERHVGRDVQQQNHDQIGIRGQRVDQRLNHQRMVEVLVFNVNEPLGKMDRPKVGL
jgi:hypothetical protein